jgi:hypothetical protein
MVRLMAQFSYAQYDVLEKAVQHGQRLIVRRRGSEYVVVPLGLLNRAGREVIEAQNPTTGDVLELYVDEVESIELVSR